MYLMAESHYMTYGEAVEKYILMLRYIDRQINPERLTTELIVSIKPEFKFTVNVFSKKD